MNFAPMRTAFRRVRGFLTIPGAISLSGIVCALAAHSVDRSVDWTSPLAAPGVFVVPIETARAVLATTATAAISALVMVYSIVLLVYTMAASSIGPRLLQRFREDRINQISIGTLGATFLYCLFALWLIREREVVHVTAAAALVLAALSILLLLYFVSTVSARVTIDQEAADIAASLDRQIDSALAHSVDVRSDEVVLPEGPDRAVPATETGYIDTIAGAALATEAGRAPATVVYAVRPGDFVMQGQTLARVLGDTDGRLDGRVRDAAPVIAARDPDGDLRFSVNLLVEIGLRALSPGVNDTFTAIGCVDRLSASLSRARARGLSVGVFSDEAGAARVVYPSIDAGVLFDEAFPPLRRAARGNGLMTVSLARALGRMAAAAPAVKRLPYLGELRRLRDDLDGCPLPDGDRADLADIIDRVMEELG